MAMKRMFGLLVSGLILSVSASVQAETLETEAGKKDVEVQVSGWDYTSGFGRMDGHRPKADGSVGEPMNLVTQVPIIFAPQDKGLSFVVMPQFVIHPFEGDFFRLRNPTVGATGVLVNSGGFVWWTRMENELPVTRKSRDAGLVLGPQMVNVLAYSIPQTNWLIKGVFVPGLQVFDSGTTSAAFYLMPSINYNLNKNWQLNLFAEEVLSRGEKNPVFEIENDPINVGLGFRYTGNGYWIQPFVTTYPFDTVNASTVHAGFFFSATVL